MSYVWCFVVWWGRGESKELCNSGSGSWLQQGAANEALWRISHSSSAASTEYESEDEGGARPDYTSCLARVLKDQSMEESVIPTPDKVTAEGSGTGEFPNQVRTAVQTEFRQRSRQNEVHGLVGVKRRGSPCLRLHDCVRLCPLKALDVHEDAEELRTRQSRVRVVHLDGHFVGEVGPVGRPVAPPLKRGHNVLKKRR